MEELILIKLGGSLITDKSREMTARPEVIERLAREIQTARRKSRNPIIVAHGSGSFGHTVAAKYQTKEGIINDQSLVGLPLVAEAAVEINRWVRQIFLKTGLPAVTFAPASFLTAKARKLRSIFTDPLLAALDLGLLPVTYGDIVFDQKQGFAIFSSETILGILAQKTKQKFKSVRIIYCGNTDGVYDADGKTIPVITPKTFEKFQKFVTGSKQTDVTGGMLHKVEESLSLAKEGIRTEIIGGERSGELTKAILGKKTSGTLIKED